MASIREVLEKNGIKENPNPWPLDASDMTLVKGMVQKYNKFKKIKEIIARDMPENYAFSDVICRHLDFEPVDYFSTISMLFGGIQREEYRLNRSFSGFPMNTFSEILLAAYPELEKRKNVITTVTLMLHDAGYGEEEDGQFMQQSNGVQQSVASTRLFVR